MRDSHTQMIELLDAVQSDTTTSCIIKHAIAGEMLKLKFGITPSDFKRLKKILTFRPFEDTGVASYRYFFARSYRFDPADENCNFIAIRVEQLKHHKQHEFSLSKQFISNLLWFDQLTDKKAVAELIED